MDKKELAYAKQTLLNVKDWDTFQKVLHNWARLLRAVTSPATIGSGANRD